MIPDRPTIHKINAYISLVLLDNSFLHTQTARANKFYTTFPSPGHIRFESVKFQGRFLLIDHRKGKLKLGEPKNGNDILEIQHLNDQS